MKLLAIETCTERCSVALAVDEDIRESHTDAPRTHSERLLPMIEALLADAGLAAADLSALAFSRGPGSFTGVRLGTSVVQGLAYGLQLPVVAVPTLAALALAAYYRCGETRILTALDARIDELYWAGYQIDSDHLTVVRMEEMVAGPESVAMPSDAEQWTGAGPGWEAYGARLRARVAPQQILSDCLPGAREVAIIGLARLEAGQSCAAHEALPVYLREKVANR
jgi:tRNA threonylcarbamoyladenosine biosynthesis protein TsaB